MIPRRALAIIQRALIAFALNAVYSHTIAADIPRRSEHDPRVRYVTYKADDVVVVQVRRGVVTRLIFDPGEKILASGTGFAAHCKDDAEWCIRADKDSNQVWVKPLDGATHNNLEVSTSKGRDYSVEFRVLPDAPKGATGDEIYRVIFQYLLPPVLPPASLANTITPSNRINESAIVSSRLRAQPEARNTDYSMETLGKGDRIAPTLAFDDGRFTYFRFPGGREIPAPFVFGADDKETRANFHMDKDMMVIHRTAGRFVLRLGEAVVGVWNDAYDPSGVDTPNGVAAPGVRRDLK